jgi:hypothetical protein
MFCILSYTKMTKYNFFWRIEITILHSHFYCFFIAQNTKQFELRFGMFGGYIIRYFYDFVS